MTVRRAVLVALSVVELVDEPWLYRHVARDDTPALPAPDHELSAATYGEIPSSEEQFVIYDKRNADAWLLADASTALEPPR